MKHLLTILAIMTMGTTLTASTIKVDAKASSIKWEASKVVGSHHGTVALKEGELKTDKDKVTGGTFIIDMTTIVNEDQTGDLKAMLEKHLKSDDFFAVEKYPTSKIVLTKIVENTANNYTVTGDLTIREKTNPVTFDAIVTTNADGSRTITAQKFSIDRTKWDIIYGSGSFFKGLADKAINDSIYFEVTIVVPK